MAGGKAAPTVPPRLPLVTLLSRHCWSRALGVIPQLGVGSASALFVTQRRGILSFMLLTWYYCGYSVISGSLYPQIEIVW